MGTFQQVFDDDIHLLAFEIYFVKQTIILRFLCISLRTQTLADHPDKGTNRYYLPSHKLRDEVKHHL